MQLQICTMNCFVQLYYEKINYKNKNDSPAKFHYLSLPPISLSLINDDEKTRKHPPIIVKFVRREVRNQIYSIRAYLRKVKDFGLEGMKNLFINENLTTKIKQLFGKGNWLRKSLQIHLDQWWYNLC